MGSTHELDTSDPVLTTDAAEVNSVLMNISISLHPLPNFDHFYCTHIKGDAAKEPITTGESIPAIIADAAAKTGRPRSDFEVEETSRNRYEKLKQFLG
jgi:hypothetical protein